MEVETPHVGPMLAHFSLLGVIFSLLGTSCALLGHFGVILVAFLVSCSAQGSILEGSEPYFRRFFVPNALIAAGSPYLYSLGLFVSPLKRGGTCAAHGIESKSAALRCSAQACQINKL